MSSFGHFDFPTPFTKELHEMGLIPYRAKAELQRRVDSLFRNPINPFYREFIDISTSGSRGLVNDMCVRAIGITRYYMAHPQQFGNAMENIELQILVRMWKQLFKHSIMQNKSYDKYMATSSKLLAISDSVFTELIRVVKDSDYIQSGDEMIKERYDEDGRKLGHRERKKPQLRYRKNQYGLSKGLEWIARNCE